MLTTRIKTYLKKNVGWTEIIIIIAFIILFIWGQIQKYQRTSNAAYTKAIIIGTHEGAKGSIYMDFKFEVDGKEIRSWMPSNNRYHIGDTINIQYQVGNPDNNDLIEK